MLIKKTIFLPIALLFVIVLTNCHTSTTAILQYNCKGNYRAGAKIVYLPINSTLTKRILSYETLYPENTQSRTFLFHLNYETTTNTEPTQSTLRRETGFCFNDLSISESTKEFDSLIDSVTISTLQLSDYKIQTGKLQLSEKLYNQKNDRSRLSLLEENISADIGLAIVPLAYGFYPSSQFDFWYDYSTRRVGSSDFYYHSFFVRYAIIDFYRKKIILKLEDISPGINISYFASNKGIARQYLAESAQRCMNKTIELLKNKQNNMLMLLY